MGPLLAAAASAAAADAAAGGGLPAGDSSLGGVHCECGGGVKESESRVNPHFFG